MGYLFLALALAAGLTKGFCGKKTSSAVVLDSDSMIMNVLRMCLCILIGFFLLLVGEGLSALSVGGTALLITVLSGVASAAFVVSWLLSVRSGAYMMVEVFLLLGVGVPILFCRLFFSEPITLWQLLGMAVLLLAVYLMCTYNASIKGKLSPKAFLLLLLCGLSNGFADLSQKLYVKTCPEGSIAAFNFYTYLFAALVLLCAYFVFRTLDKKRGQTPRAPFAVVRPIALYVVVMAVCLFAYSYFKTLAAGYLDAVRLYPLSQGCAVTFSLLMAAFLFGERINTRCIVGVALSFLGLLLINLDLSALFS